MASLRDIQNQRLHERRRGLLLKGLCVYCGRRKATGANKCAPCRSHGLDRKREFHSAVDVMQKLVDGRINRTVELACYQMTTSSDGQFFDTLPELESPDGPYVDGDEGEVFVGGVPIGGDHIERWDDWIPDPRRTMNGT